MMKNYGNAELFSAIDYSSQCCPTISLGISLSLLFVDKNHKTSVDGILKMI
jgi:hypothetical protein